MSSHRTDITSIHRTSIISSIRRVTTTRTHRLIITRASPEAVLISNPNLISIYKQLSKPRQSLQKQCCKLITLQCSVNCKLLTTTPKIPLNTSPNTSSPLLKAHAHLPSCASTTPTHIPAATSRPSLQLSVHKPHSSRSHVVEETSGQQ